MTHIETMKQALDALEWAESLADTSDRSCQEAKFSIDRAIAALRAAIAQPDDDKQKRLDALIEGNEKLQAHLNKRAQPDDRKQRLNEACGRVFSWDAPKLDAPEQQLVAAFAKSGSVEAIYVVDHGEAAYVVSVTTADKFNQTGAQPESEPVAWMVTDCIGERTLCFTKPAREPLPDKIEPLYVAPVGYVPLTPIDIYTIAVEVRIPGYDESILEFGYAIERAVRGIET